jgi:hypothetical protein
MPIPLSLRVPTDGKQMQPTDAAATGGNNTSPINPAIKGAFYFNLIMDAIIDVCDAQTSCIIGNSHSPSVKTMSKPFVR